VKRAREGVEIMDFAMENARRVGIMSEDDIRDMPV